MAASDDEILQNRTGHLSRGGPPEMGWADNGDHDRGNHHGRAAASRVVGPRTEWKISQNGQIGTGLDAFVSGRQQ
jgi:hypothetical protein